MDAPTLLQLFLRPVVNLRAKWPTLTGRILSKKKYVAIVTTLKIIGLSFKLFLYKTDELKPVLKP